VSLIVVEFDLPSTSVFMVMLTQFTLGVKPGTTCKFKGTDNSCHYAKTLFILVQILKLLDD